MSRILIYSGLFQFFCFFSYSVETVIWSGQVSSDGTPSNAINLVLHKKYKIKVSGFVNLGKWILEGNPLANDACYEYDKEEKTEKLESFKNSLSISVCDNKYHSNHIYQSLPFEAKNNKIHFWVYDANYEDNYGSFEVQIIQITNS